MLRQLCYWIVLVPTWAMAFESVTFITSRDTFTVNKSAQHFTIDGKAVSGNLMGQIQPLLTGPVTNDCPKLNGQAPIVAVVKDGNQSERREFFIQRGTVRIANKCLTVSGEGLLYLPLHRSWLIGPFHDGLRLGSPFKVQNGDTTVASLVKKDGEWADTREHTDLDWDFFSRFEQSLADYRITYRMLPDAEVGKPVVIMTSGFDKFKFVRVAAKTWGLERPGHKWLDVSGDWGFWFDLEPAIWRDRNAAEYEKAEATGVAADQRLEIMRGLETAAWTRSLEAFYHRRLIDQREDLRVRIAALERLKSKPSWRNVGAEMQALQSDPPDELLNLLTIALRARNMRGPTFDGTGSRSAVVRTWSEWWRENSSRKD